MISQRLFGKALVLGAVSLLVLALAPPPAQAGRRIYLPSPQKAPPKRPVINWGRTAPSTMPVPPSRHSIIPKMVAPPDMPKPGSAKMLPGGGVMLNPQSEPSGKGSPGWDPGDKPAEFLPSTQGAAPGQGGGEKGIIIVNSKSYVPLPEGSNLGPGDMEAKGIVIVNSKPFMPAPQGAAPGKGSPGWDPTESPAPGPGGMEEKGIIVVDSKPGQGGGEKGIIIVNNKSYVPLPEGSNLGPGDMAAKGIVIINNRPFMPAPQGAAPGQVGIVTPTD